MNLKRQIRRLLAVEALGAFRPVGSCWVLLLAVRGFSLAEIGLAEGFFHVVSFCCEIPSGVAADLMGRRRVMVWSQILFACSALAMIFSRGLAGICAALGCSALGYNLASGTREALLYDSLLQAGEERRYMKLCALDTVIYRLCAAAATLCAGWVLLLGYQKGYGVDLGIILAGAALALGLQEPVVTQAQAERDVTPFSERLKTCLRESARFLWEHPRTALILLFNALVGAGATLLGFYLQDGLPNAGVETALLGPLLLAVGLGGAVGARLSVLLEKWSYRSAVLLSAAGVLAGLALAAAGRAPLMAAGGFLAAFSDDCLQVRTDSDLNAAIPSDQRATLVSVSSMLFSLVMIVLSPLGGALAG